MLYMLHLEFRSYHYLILQSDVFQFRMICFNRIFLILVAEELTAVSIFVLKLALTGADATNGDRSVGQPA